MDAKPSTQPWLKNQTENQNLSPENSWLETTTEILQILHTPS